MSRDENGHDHAHMMMSYNKLKPGESRDPDTLIEVVLGTSREDFNLSS